MAKKVRDVMTRPVRTLSADSTLRDAAREMRDGDIGSVIVMMNDGSICGIVTDRDIVIRGLAQGKNLETRLADVCSRELVTLSPDQTIDEAIALMRENGVRRLPVEEGGRPVGILSLGDLAIERDEKSVLGQISAQPASH
jgi:CBS domain-containing protein